MHADLIELALLEIPCNQKELAKKLKVSQTQISKWKANEYMSKEAEKSLIDMLDLGSICPTLALKVKGVDNGKKWQAIIDYIVSDTVDECESGYMTENYTPIEDGSIASTVISLMADTGIEFEKTLDPDLIKAYELIVASGDHHYEEIDELLYDDLRCSLAYKTIGTLNDLYGFYCAYIADYSKYEDLDETVFDLYYALTELAYCKMSESVEYFQDGISQVMIEDFRRKTYKEIEANLHDIKRVLICSGRPYKGEITGITYLKDFNELGVRAESVALGFSKNLFHPDMYMNELIESQRVLHVILPLLCEKAGLSQEDIQGALSQVRK